MESLPEDVIVHIFSFLPQRDLLGPVRGVCQAWRTLALQRDAWKRVTLSCRYQVDLELLERALRLAPCLYNLEVDPFCSREMQQAMATTSCQVERLHITTCLKPCALSVLRPQVPHTKYLKLTLADDAAEILALIQDMALVELDIGLCESDMGRGRGELVVDRPFRNSCLKRLSVVSVKGCSDSDQLIGSLVTENAASLQEFACWDEFREMPLTLKALRALNSRLKLTIPASSLNDIIGMENLSHLAVRVFGFYHEETERPGFSALSRGLICASSVAFHNVFLVPKGRNESVSMCLQEMGTLGRCGHIESLAFSNLDLEETELLPLNGLPNLQELRLHSVSLPMTGLWMDAIEGLKSLQLLHLQSSGCNELMCSVPALWRLIARVPGLHVIRQWLRVCCTNNLSLPDSERDKPCGLRGHCQPECALCARFYQAISSRWITISST